MSQHTSERETTTLMGAVTAPATHDLMNVLAIINEHAGLLSDLLRFAKGEPLPPEQLEKGIKAIEAQVSRGRTLLTQLNSFAHATDLSPAPLDAGNAVAEVVHLTQRKFHAQLASPAPSHVASCDPIVFRLLIYRLLEAACDPSLAEGPCVTMTLQDPTLLVTIQPQSPAELAEPLAPLAQSLGATLTCSGDTLTLSLPR
ncbi:hypothetical protein DSLASN_41550 [Desulfoluna limicola]|uniref:Histidine kinase n=1 Tax=Desulfoluna limicola TaxID=2810562 RepID=A0ABM7PLW7_9BACT|nr:hypothetical protein [Desulfoluna limicola]BCS98523.1 hypothetical protein DSLASN_41550 [Desulfoluna limicola]